MLQGCGVRQVHTTRGPIKLARELSLTGAVVPDTRRPPTIVGTQRDRRTDGHRGSAFPAFPVTARGVIAAGRRRQDREEDAAGAHAGTEGGPHIGPRTSTGGSGRRHTAWVSSILRTGMSCRRSPRCPTSSTPVRSCCGSHAGGHRLALPVMQGKGQPLLFRAWSPGDAMNEGIWGIPEPKADKALLAPDVFLVPLLAFDRQGWRLGYGGGFYDRTLREARAYAARRCRRLRARRAGGRRGAASGL